MTVDILKPVSDSHLKETPSIATDSDHRRDRIIAGVSYCIISFTFLLLYVAVLLVLKKKSMIFSSTAYRIIFHLGVADCLQLLFHFLGGIFTIVGSTFNFWLSKICGGLLNSAWITLMPLTLLLAVNRFFAIFYYQNSDSLSLMDKNIKMLIGCCWFWGAIFFICYMTRYCSILYDANILAWGYDNSEWSETIAFIEFRSTTILLLITGIFYAVIIIKLLLLRWKQVGITTTPNSQGMRNEIRVLIQAIAITGYTTFCLWAWHDYAIFFDANKWVVFTVNTIWIINGGINPCLYLTLNKTMRRELYSLVTLSTSTTAVFSVSKKGEILDRVKRTNAMKRFTV